MNKLFRNLRENPDIDQKGPYSNLVLRFSYQKGETLLFHRLISWLQEHLEERAIQTPENLGVSPLHSQILNLSLV